MSFLVLLVFLQTRPVAICFVTPNGVHSIAFEQAYVTGRDDVSTVVLNELVLRVADVEGHLIAEVADAVLPSDVELPTPRFQLTDIHRRYTDTDGVRQLQAGEHVVVVLPIVVERCVQTSAQEAEVDTDISGLDSLPSLVLRSEIGLIVALLCNIGGTLRDGGNVVIESQHGTVTKLTPRSTQLQIAHPVEVEPLLLVHTPGSTHRRECLPTLGGSQTRASVVTDVGLQQIALGEVVVDATEVGHHRPGLDVIAQRGVRSLSCIVVVKRIEVV